MQQTKDMWKQERYTKYIIYIVSSRGELDKTNRKTKQSVKKSPSSNVLAIKKNLGLRTCREATVWRAFMELLVTYVQV